MGQVLYGEAITSFSNVLSSMISVLHLLMGNLEYETLHRIHPKIAPLYLIAIIIGIFGILLASVA